LPLGGDLVGIGQTCPARWLRIAGASQLANNARPDGLGCVEEEDLRASRVFAHALRLFEGDRTAAKRWLSTPQKALGHQSPLTVARTEVGAIEVDRLMGRLEYGVFT
jgi:putative toxin-antitoxin system antitoxin component (TIGR02293 family)